MFDELDPGGTIEDRTPSWYVGRSFKHPGHTPFSTTAEYSRVVEQKGHRKRKGIGVPVFAHTP
jgi:hypothetical protein